jgi:gliding motility-associated-like protein
MKGILGIYKRNVSFFGIFILFGFILSIEANAQLTSSFSVNKSEGCIPLIVVFDNTSIGNPDSCIWDFGNGNSSRLCNPVATYTTAGTFTVTLTVVKGAQRSVSTKSITVFPSPIADFDANKYGGCTPLPVSFTDKSQSSGAVLQSWVWDFGDGRSSNQRNPVNTYLAESSFNVTLIVTDDKGCKGSLTKNAFITTTSSPKPEFSVSNLVACKLPFDVAFTNKTQSAIPLTYSWDFGNGNTSTATNPQNAFQTAGVYPVKLTGTNAFGCADDTIISIEIVLEQFIPEIILPVTSGCAPLNISFSANANIPISLYNWNSGDGSVSFAPSGTFTYNNQGTFQLSGNFQNAQGCSERLVVPVNVLPKPVAAFTASPTEGCGTPLDVQFNSGTPNAVSHSWNFGDGTISTLQNPLKTYTQSRTFNVRYVAVNAAGCRDTIVLSDFIKIGPPTLSLTAENPFGCIPHRTDFILIKDGPGVYDNIVWDFGNGQTFTGVNPPPQTYNTEGIFNVSANITFRDNCPPVTLTTTVTAGNKPSVSGTVSPTEVCVKKPGVKGIATGGGPFTVFTWHWGDGSTSAGANASYEYTDPGRFNVSVVGANFGCKDSVFIDQILVNPPMANFRLVNDCGGLNVSFRNLSVGNSTSLWNFGDGTTLASNATVINHQFPAFGTYNVKLVVTNTASGCVDSIVNEVQLANNRPSLNLSPLTGCLPFKVSLSDTTRRFRSITWDLGDTIIVSNSFERVYDQPGRFPVNVYTLDQGSCRDTFRFPNLIRVVDFTADFSFNPPGGCAPALISFKDETVSSLSTINNWKWDFAGLGTSTVKNPDFTFVINDSIPVRLIVQDNIGCRDTITKKVPVLEPKADFSSAFTSVCTDVVFDFKNLSSGVNPQYFWDFGNGSTSTDFEPGVIYTVAGEYDVQLVVKDANGCADTLVRRPYVRVENFDYDFDAFPRTKSCPELLTNFTISPADILYNYAYWDFGNNNQSLDTSRFPTNIYNEAGSFDVRLVLEDYRGCKDTIVKDDFVNVRGPRGSFTFSPDSGCVPLQVTLEANFVGTKINVWDFGNGDVFFDSLAQQSITYVYDEPGVATPSLVLDDGLGCIVLLEGSPIKASGVKAVMEVDKPGICTNDLVSFKDISSDQIFSPVIDRVWDFGDGNTGNQPLESHLYQSDSTTIYWAVLSVTSSFGCVDHDTFPVKVYAFPEIDAGDNQVVCKGNEVPLSAFGASFYEWSPAASLKLPDTQSPVALPINDTWYRVKGYDTIACPSYDSVFVEVLERISGTAGPDTIICLGDSVQLFSRTDGILTSQVEFTWSPPDFLNNTSIPSPVSRPQGDMAYTVNIKSGDCNELNIPVYIKVGVNPEVRAGEDQTIFKGQQATLSAGSDDIVAYMWSPEYNISCLNCAFPKVSPEKDTTYFVRVMNSFGCSDIDSVQIKVYETCSGDNVSVPNTFTPNNDGLNDVFLVRGSELSNIEQFRIYNRWGEMIFESPDINKGWDGTHNGVPVNSGVYVYYIEATCLNGQAALVKGNVTVLR